MQETLLMGPSRNNDIGLGDLVDGVRFFGEQPTTGFINGTRLASQIGLTQGTAQHSNEPWLHFELDGKTLYVAKKTYRYSISWNSIHARGAVFGTRTVVINGLTYKVRLLTGANTNPTPATGGYNPVGTEDSEWNRLIYIVHNGVHTNRNNKTPPGAWPLYGDTDLVVHSSGGNGHGSWTQETNAASAGQCVARGYLGVTHFLFNASSSTLTYYGWRPVLELGH